MSYGCGVFDQYWEPQNQIYFIIKPQPRSLNFVAQTADLNHMYLHLSWQHVESTVGTFPTYCVFKESVVGLNYTQVVVSFAFRVFKTEIHLKANIPALLRKTSGKVKYRCLGLI